MCDLERQTRTEIADHKVAVGIYIKKSKTLIQKDIAPLCSFSVVYNSQEYMEATQVPINSLADKDAVHIYNRIVLSHKKEILLL